MAKGNSVGECKLCGVDRELVQSHIIPEFAYAPVYDNKRRIAAVLRSADSNWNPKAPPQKGIRERLLCRDCEQHINANGEKYIAELLRGNIKVHHCRTEKFIYLRGVDYAKFKLFGLSVLWRAGIATHDMFRKVELGERHQEALRLMLRAADPGRPQDYPFVLSTLIYKDGRIVDDLISAPTRVRLNGHFVYRFVFLGLLWMFFVSSHQKPHRIRPAFPSQDGKVMLMVSNVGDVEFIIREVGKLIV